MPLNETAYETLQGLRRGLDTAGTSQAMGDASILLLQAGNELMFYQDESVAQLGRDLNELGQKMTEARKDLAVADSRMAGLL